MPTLHWLTESWIRCRRIKTHYTNCIIPINILFYHYNTTCMYFWRSHSRITIGSGDCLTQIRKQQWWTTSHYDDVIMSAIASQITSLTIVYSTVYSGVDKKNIKAPRHWPLCGILPVTSEFPAQRASNAENVFIWWRHHAYQYTAW